jgi:putative DNA modification/repair radical SAM protein
LYSPFVRYTSDVTLESKLRILADAAKYDTACASSGSERKRATGGIGNAAPGGICHSFTPDGRCVSLLKVLLTNYCIYDCVYCVNRVSSDTPRARFTVEELVKLTMDFYKRNYIEGLFLSSGIIQDADYTMEQLIAVARELRTIHRFCGYIHLKAIAGASRELLIEAGKWADRLSVNVELPAQADLNRLAPAKKLVVIEKSMAQVKDASAELNDGRSARNAVYMPAGQTTQMIIGATPSSDRDLLTKATDLYKTHSLQRVYYSAFSPIPFASSDLPVKPPPLVREHRLYQADWLLRFYGFRTDELVTGSDGNLSLTKDPKLAWALQNQQFFPVDVNKAPKEVLLRVPGVGARNVERILSIRRLHALTMADLSRLKVAINRARHFMVTADSVPSTLDSAALGRAFEGRASQMSLFEAPKLARAGEF